MNTLAAITAHNKLVALPLNLIPRVLLTLMMKTKQTAEIIMVMLSFC
jgi:hypothetical protein